jgi:hypothetical protein
MLTLNTPPVGDPKGLNKKMATLKVLGEILPVLGTVGLLGLWLYQQTGVERRTGELARLAAARSVYQTYQSNNAVFNAINEIVKDKPELSGNLRNFQTYNYELGLYAIENVLSPDERKGIPAAPNAYSSTPDFAKKMEVTQTRLGELQNRLDAKEKKVKAAAESAKRTYLWLYVALSLVSVAGAIFKILSH